MQGEAPEAKNPKNPGGPQTQGIFGTANRRLVLPEGQAPGAAAGGIPHRKGPREPQPGPFFSHGRFRRAG